MGIFYQSLTQYLGFCNYGDEYKVMGLAPYGNPTYQNKIEKMIKLRKKGKFQLDMKYFRHHKQDMSFEWSDGVPKFEIAPYLTEVPSRCVRVNESESTTVTL